MAKPGVRGGAPEATTETRARLVQAAAETLKQEGFAGTSARAIARTGGFAQGLIFYHFGTVNDLLLAALDATSEARMERYADAVSRARTLPEVLAVATDIYREDLDAGHLSVLAELIAGASTVPELGPAIVDRVEPWVRFTADHVRRVLAGSPLERHLPAEDLAFAVVGLYLGLEMLTGLGGDRQRAESLFVAAGRLASVLGTVLAMTETTAE